MCGKELQYGADIETKRLQQTSAIHSYNVRMKILEVI